MNIFADLSKYQEPDAAHKVDFGKLKTAVVGTILRVQYGYTTPDEHYTEFVSGCKANKIPFSTYAFFAGWDINDSIKEAVSCVKLTDKDSEIVWLDVEKNTCHNPSDLIPAVQAYVDYLRKNGGYKKIGLYSYESFYLSNKLNKITGIDALWLAKYGINDGSPHTQPATYCDLWQYSSTATLSGISGHVDVSIIPSNGKKPLNFFTGAVPVVQTPVTPVPSTPVTPSQPVTPSPKPTSPSLSDDVANLKKDVAELKKEIASLKNVPTPSPKPVQPAAPKLVYHKVVSGDTVSELAAKYSSSIQDIKNWNKLDSKYTISIGQNLRVK